jgi:hypothetical protein
MMLNGRMGPRMRQGLLCVFLCAWTLPAQAIDPVLMLLLSAARELVAAAARNPPAPAQPAPPVSATRYPGTVVEPEDIRRLIDECFGYLSETQRREIFDSLHAQLSDPKNAGVRVSMIDYFTVRAAAIREAQQRLARLSGPDQDRLLVEFKVALAAMTADESAQLAALLRQRVLPVPHDLNEQLLAAIDAR